MGGFCRKTAVNQSFVDQYRMAIGSKPTVEQQLLLIYFEENVANLPAFEVNSPTDFHKSFRNVDICKEGYQDMVVWSLLSGHACNKIWDVLEAFYA